MNRLLLAVLLLLGLVSIWWLLQRPPADARPQADGSRATATRPAEATAVVPEGSAAEGAPALPALERSAKAAGELSKAALAEEGLGELRMDLTGRDGQLLHGLTVTVYRQQDMPTWQAVGIGRETEPAAAEMEVQVGDGHLRLQLPARVDWRLRAHGPFVEEAQMELSALAAGEQLDLGRWVLQPADRLVGRVTSPQGEAVAGARIILRDSAASLLDGGNRVQVATSDATGKFHFDGLRAGRYRLEARASGFGDGLLNPLVSTGSGTTQELVLPLTAGRSLRGQVLDADGRPVAGAIIQRERRFLDLLATDRGQADKLPAGAVRSDEQGRFLFGGVGEEPAQLRVQAEGFAPSTVTEGVRGTELVVRLKPLVSIAGILKRPDGQPAAETRLTLVAADQDRGDWVMPGEQFVTTTDPQGAFRFSSLNPGNYTPQAVSPGGQLSLGAIPLLSSVEQLEWQMQPASHLVVHVTSEGHAVPGARLQAVPAGQAGDGSIRIDQEIGGPDGQSRRRVIGGVAPVDATADAFGYALLPGLEEGSWDLSARAEGFATTQMRIERIKGAQQVELEVAPAAQLRVLTMSASGQPLEGVEVRLNALTAAPGMPQAAILKKQSDAGGRVLWHDLVPGAYELAYRAGMQEGYRMLTMLSSDADDGSAEHVVETIQLSAGESLERRIEVAALASLEVTTTRDGRPAAGVEVWLEAPGEAEAFGLGEHHQAAWTDAAGWVRLPPVEPGDWRLVARASRDAPPRESELRLAPGNAEAAIDLTGASFHGVLMGKDGPLAGAQVSLQKATDGNAPARQAISIMIVDNGDGPAMEVGGSDGGLAHATTGRDGSYRLADIPAGEWQVKVKAKGYGDWLSERILVAGVEERDLGVRQLEAEAAIVGTLPGFDLEAMMQGGSFTIIQLEDAAGATQGVVMPRRDGSYRFDGLSAGSYRVSYGEYRSPLLTLRAGQELVHDLPQE